MSPDQMIGWTLNQTTAITAIVSTRIYHGLRPVGTTIPCVNFYRVGGGTRQHGFETSSWSLNCRASTASTALQLARLVIDLFHGTSGMGTYGSQNGFEISRASLRNDAGLIPEPEDNLYNAPVDIQMVYPTSTVS